MQFFDPTNQVFIYVTLPNGLSAVLVSFKVSNATVLHPHFTELFGYTVPARQLGFHLVPEVSLAPSRPGHFTLPTSLFSGYDGLAKIRYGRLKLPCNPGDFSILYLIGQNLFPPQYSSEQPD